MDAVSEIERAVEADGPLPNVRVLVLGTLRVEHRSGALHVAGVHRRRLLAFLASRAGQAVAVGTIIDALWGDQPPLTAAKTVQTHVARLRASLAEVGVELIETTPAGYRLANAAVDADAFEQLTAEGHRRLAAFDFTGAVAALEKALALWQGDPYADFPDVDFARNARTRLAGIHAVAVEDLAEARLESGAVNAVAAELERLVTVDPGRERAWALLMRALYAGGRQQDALVVFQRARRALADEFGLEPGPELRDVERRVLEHDPELMIAQRTDLPSALRAYSDEIVGRAEEHAWLIDAWDAARRGNGQLRVLTGPIDSGRTRLVAQLAAGAAADCAHVIYHRAANDLVDRLVGVGGATSSAAVAFLAERSRRQPVLLIVDDVEWATVETIDALAVLATEVERIPALIVLVADTSGGGPAIRALSRLDPAGVRARELGPLADADIARIVLDDGVYDPEVQSAIVTVAHGLPGLARREAATWAERAAGDRVNRAAASSAGALAAADEARDVVVDEVASLVRARTHRHRMASAAWAGRQPYRGLAPYGPSEADVFVGRERLVAELAAGVLDRRLVVVTGPSGSGKSSLVQAGLVPLVQSGRLPGGGPWRALVTTPGVDPIHAFDSLDQLDLPGSQLLIVDQFEEAIVNASGAVDALIARLMDLALDPALDARIVLVVRADQYPTLAGLRPFGDLVERSLLVVSRPTDHELRRIVTEPAERAGCRVEPELVDAIVADVGNSEGALPLMSAALAALWESRVGDVLTLERYRSQGGLAASVERLGARVLDDAARRSGIIEDDVRRALMLLVDITEDGSWMRRQVSHAEVAAELGPAFDALVDARLVVRRDDEYELVHEVVFRSWSRLAAWLAEARVDLALERELQRDARAWSDRGCPDDDVWRGTRLTTADDWYQRNREASSTEVASFVAAGMAVAERHRVDTENQLVRERRATRRLRRALIAASALLVGALIAATVAIVARRQASDQRDRAKEAAGAERDVRARAEADRDAAEIARLVAESERALSGRLDLALLLAVEARRRADTLETRGALLTALTQTLPDPVENVLIGDPLPTALAGFIPSGWDQALDVDLSGDGSTVLVYGRTNTDEHGLAAFDVDTGVELRRIAGELPSFAIDPTGSFAVAGNAETAGVYALRGGTDFELVSAGAVALSLAGPSSAGLSLSPDGSTVSVPFVDGSVSFYSTATGAELDLPALPGPVKSAGFDPTGLFFYGDTDPDTGAPRANRWDLATGTLRVSTILEADVWPPPTVYRASPDGAVLVGVATNGAVDAWDTRSGALMGSPRDLGPVSSNLAAPSDRASAVAFVSGRTIALGRLDGSILLYDLATDRTLRRPLEASSGAIWGIAVSSDMQRLVSVADDGLIRIWQDDDRGPITELIAEDRQLIDVSGDGSRYLLRTPGGALEVHSADGAMAPISIPAGAPGTFFNAALYTLSNASLSYDGRWVTQTSQAAPGSPGPARVVEVETGNIIWSDAASEFDAGVVDREGHRLFLIDHDAGGDEGVAVVDLSSGTVAARLDESKMALIGAEPRGVYPTPDGANVDTIWSDGRLRRLDVDTLDVVAEVEPPFVIQGDITTDPVTDEIYLAGWPGGIGRVDLSSGDDTWSRSPDPTILSNATLSPDGSLVAALHPFSASIALFDAETLRPLGRPIPIRSGKGRFAFLSDGALLVNGPFGVSRIELDPGEWQATACHVAGRNLTTDEWEAFFGDEPYRATCPDRAPASA